MDKRSLYSVASQEEKSKILNRQPEEEALHVDETSVKIAGKLHWVHTLCFENDCGLIVPETRSGKDEGPVSILKSAVYTGTPVYDPFSSCLHLEESNAHIQRSMRGGVEYDQGPAWQEMLDLFEEIAQTKQELADQSKRASPLRLFKRYRKQYLDIGSRGMKKQEKIFWPA